MAKRPRQLAPMFLAKQNYISGLVACLVVSSALAFPIQPLASSRQTDSRSIRFVTTTRSSSDAPPSAAAATASFFANAVLQKISTLQEESRDYAESFGLGEFEADTYALFRAIREVPVPLGLKGQPFVLRHAQLAQALGRDVSSSPTCDKNNWFTMRDLEQACQDDFLDAVRGSTNQQKPWQISAVSVPRGDSFEAARMTYKDVCSALEQGTVIFNAAGAHIPKLAGPSLAACDATSLPCALNLYVTAPRMRTSAPPHTDKQDVVVLHTSGQKSWKVFSVPTPALKLQADIFARGKLDDSLPLYSLTGGDSQCELLIDTTLYPGDVMFCPAGFPHTTSTVAHDDANDPSADEHSLHLTLGLDHHIWELDYLQARRLALKRAGITDAALGQTKDIDSAFVGKVNELPLPVLADVLAELPLGLLDEDEQTAERIEVVAKELQRISQLINSQTANAIDLSVSDETIRRVRQQGLEIFETHRDMYLAALDEGRLREAERAMTAHLLQSASTVMTSERIQRLSLFRVKKFYDKINESKASLKAWSLETKQATAESANGPLPDNWQYTLPLKVGDDVEADLGGALFPARVTRASGDTFDVQFFDGDSERGLDRGMLKLLAPPESSSTQSAALVNGVDTSSMTKKELKKWKKDQEKLQSKR